VILNVAQVKLIHPLAEEKAWPVEEKKPTAEPTETLEKADKVRHPSMIQPEHVFPPFNYISFKYYN
jgi:hypothetical protein